MGAGSLLKPLGERLRADRTRARRRYRGVCAQIRAFARTCALRICESYARIEGAKSFVFNDITYIIRTKHLRTGINRLGSNQRLQRHPRLPRNDECIGQVRLNRAVPNLGNVRLAFVYPRGEVGLGDARVLKIRAEIGIRAPSAMSHKHRYDIPKQKVCQ